MDQLPGPGLTGSSGQAATSCSQDWFGCVFAAPVGNNPLPKTFELMVNSFPSGCVPVAWFFAGCSRATLRSYRSPIVPRGHLLSLLHGLFQQSWWPHDAHRKSVTSEGASASFKGTRLIATGSLFWLSQNQLIWDPNYISKLFYFCFIL